jgi:hypothetical protein
MTTETLTPENLTAALTFAAEVGMAIKTAGSIPSGHLYASLMGRMSYEQYEGLIRLLVSQNLVLKALDRLVWIG